MALDLLEEENWIKNENENKSSRYCAVLSCKKNKETYIVIISKLTNHFNKKTRIEEMWLLLKLRKVQIRQKRLIMIIQKWKKN